MRYHCRQCWKVREVQSFRLFGERCPDCGFDPVTERFISLDKSVRRVVLVSTPIASRMILFSYPVAITLISVMLLVLPAWMFMDASFDSALTWVRVDLGIPDGAGGQLLACFSPEMADEYHRWDTLGPRIMLLLASAGVLLFSFTIIFTRIILKPPRKWPLVTFGVALIGMTLVYFQHDNLVWNGTQHRLNRQSWRFQAAVDPLLKNWPDQPGTLPVVGKYWAEKKYPGRIVLEEIVTHSYPLDDDFGRCIDRLPNGGVRFSLEPQAHFTVEYHPDGQGPALQSFSRSGELKLKRSTQLRDGGFLTEYE